MRTGSHQFKNIDLMEDNLMPIKVRKKAVPSPSHRLAYSKREVAALLGVSERSLNNWVKEGRIVARKAGSRLLFPVKALEDFLSGTDSTGTPEVMS